MNSAASPRVLGLDHHRWVQQQSDRDEEYGDEHGRAEEVDPVHQPSLVGDQAVERESGEERADDPLDPERLSDDGGDQECFDRDHVADGSVAAEDPEGASREQRHDHEADDHQDAEPDHERQDDLGG